jgi:hypothetical protein
MPPKNIDLASTVDFNVKVPYKETLTKAQPDDK